MPLSRPEPLAEAHEFNDFISGVSSLDDWLKRRARPNQLSGASRTFVIAEGRRVIGYYALASGRSPSTSASVASDATCRTLFPGRKAHPNGNVR